IGGCSCSADEAHSRFPDPGPPPDPATATPQPLQSELSYAGSREYEEAEHQGALPGSGDLLDLLRIPLSCRASQRPLVTKMRDPAEPASILPKPYTLWSSPSGRACVPLNGPITLNTSRALSRETRACLPASLPAAR